MKRRGVLIGVLVLVVSLGIVVGFPAYQDASSAMTNYLATSYNPITWDITAMDLAAQKQAIEAEEKWYADTFKEIYELKPDAYPTINPTESELVSGDIASDKLNRILLGRLSYLAKDLGNSMIILSGYRDSVKQSEMAESYLKQGSRYTRRIDGSVFDTIIKQVVVAAPGKSRHELGIAVDLERHLEGHTIWGELTNKELEKYGLWKPMSYEPWHYEPVETKKGR